MSLAQKHRTRCAAQRGSLTLYLAVAAAFHGGMMAGGIVPWQPIEPPDLAVESVQPIEFVYLETETETEQNSDRRSNIDAIAGGEAKPNLPIAVGKPGIEESLKENSTTANKSIAPLVPIPVSPGSIVPASSAVNTDQEKATETEDEKPESVATPPQPPSEPSNVSNPEVTEAPVVSAPSNDSAFAGLPQLEPDLFSPDSLTPGTDFNPSERIAPSEPNLLDQPSPSLAANLPTLDTPTSDAPTSDAPTSDAPTSTDQAAVPFEAALNLGREFAEIANSNRTAANELGVDAEQDPVWGDYLAEMNQQIEQHWQQIQVDVDVTRSVKVRFTVNPSGELTDWEVTEPSGLAIADEAAVQSIQRSAPFEPLPPAANQQPLTRTLTFYYSVRQRESIQ